MYLATMTIVTKSNVSDASSLTASTMCATFKRARIDDRNRSQAVCFCEIIHLRYTQHNSIRNSIKGQG